MAEVDNDGIALFSRPVKKKGKIIKELAARQRHAVFPEAEFSLREAGQDATAAQERSGGQAPHTRQDVDADDLRTAAADTEGATSTSGQAAEQEMPVTFRNLGISEWLDR